MGEQAERGAVFADARGEDRTMRVSHHPDRGIVVVSLWLGPLCRGSFRLPADDLDRLLAALGDVAVGRALTEAVGAAPPGSPGGPGPLPGTGVVDSAAVIAAAPPRATAAG